MTNTPRKPGTRFAGPEESPGFLLWHTTLFWQRRITAALAPFDLTHVQFVLLACTWWLCEHGEPPNQQAIARQAGTDVMMTSQVLRTLERKKLVERHVDEFDTRSKRLTLTQAGFTVAQRAVKAVEDVDAAVFGAAGADLVSVLRRIQPARS